MAALIEFYRDHPQLRDELHDERVIERLWTTGLVFPAASELSDPPEPS
ncbi:MAG: hypothetical protein ACK5LN_02260 [Propioniciclava sp.]